MSKIVWSTVLLGVMFFGSNFAEEPLFISLGSNCEAAVKLRDNHLRAEAFPFDWLTTLNHDRFITLLNDDFQFFLDQKYLFQHPDHPDYFENYYYEIEFRHDGPFSDQVKSKYERRIERFRKLGQYPGRVFFIRTAYDFENDPNAYWAQEDQSKITIDQARILKQTLDQLFPSLDFILIIINYKEENVPKIEGIDGVIEFKVRKLHKVIDYAAFFNHLTYFCKISNKPNAIEDD